MRRSRQNQRPAVGPRMLLRNVNRTHPICPAGVYVQSPRGSDRARRAGGGHTDTEYRHGGMLGCHKFFCFFPKFCYSTGLVQLYIAGLPLRSCRTIGAPSVQGAIPRSNFPSFYSCQWLDSNPSPHDCQANSLPPVLCCPT